MSETTLFRLDIPAGPQTINLPAAQEARDRGMARAELGAPIGWHERAMAAIRRTCEKHADFIVDDIWMELNERPEEARAMGPMVLAAVKLGWCEATERYQPSAQVQCHGNPRRVWRSLIINTGKAGEGNPK